MDAAHGKARRFWQSLSPAPGRWAPAAAAPLVIGATRPAWTTCHCVNARTDHRRHPVQRDLGWGGVGRGRAGWGGCGRCGGGHLVVQDLEALPVLLRDEGDVGEALLDAAHSGVGATLVEAAGAGAHLAVHALPRLVVHHAAFRHAALHLNPPAAHVIERVASRRTGTVGMWDPHDVRRLCTRGRMHVYSLHLCRNFDGSRRSKARGLSRGRRRRTPPGLRMFSAQAANMPARLR